MKWNDSWGRPEDHNIVEGKDSLGGFSVGQRIEAFRDNDEEGIYIGDAGEIVGIAFTPKGMFYPDRNSLVVNFDDIADLMLVDPDYVEHEA